MEIITETLVNLLNQTGFMTLSYKNFIMVAVALFFLYLAIKKGYEPLLLVPISFGMLLVNLFPDIMMTVEEAKRVLREKAGLSDTTITYLYNYRWGDDLLLKLAAAVEGKG